MIAVAYRSTGLNSSRALKAGKGLRTAHSSNLAAAGTNVFLEPGIAKEANHGAVEGLFESLLIVIRSSEVTIVLG